LTLIHLVSIPVTNTSVNPARSTGPALFAGGGHIEQLWLFWLAPIIGAVIAGLLSRWMYEREALIQPSSWRRAASHSLCAPKVDLLDGRDCILERLLPVPSLGRRSRTSSSVSIYWVPSPLPSGGLAELLDDQGFSRPVIAKPTEPRSKPAASTHKQPRADLYDPISTEIVQI